MDSIGSGGKPLGTNVTLTDATVRLPGRLGAMTSPYGPSTSERVDLNPFFVAALMGLPVDWLTHCTSEVTASCQQQLQKPSGSSLPVAGG